VQVIGLGLVLLQGLFPAIVFDPHELAVDPLGPTAEIVDLAADLLLSGTAGVGREGKVRVGLLRPLGCFTGAALLIRIARHGATSATSGQVASPPAAITRRGQLYYSVVQKVVSRK
jgi:hypothetical protein